jgi:hypothetical protein
MADQTNLSSLLHIMQSVSYQFMYRLTGLCRMDAIYWNLIAVGFLPGSCKFRKIEREKSFFFIHIYLITTVCFDRITGDQQHFIRRDELKVCFRSWICFSGLPYVNTECDAVFVCLRLLGRSSLLCCTTSMLAS